MVVTREHIGYVIFGSCVGNFCYRYLRSVKSEASEQVNMNGQIVIRGSDHFVVDWYSRCGGRKYGKNVEGIRIELSEGSNTSIHRDRCVRFSNMPIMGRSNLVDELSIN